MMSDGKVYVLKTVSNAALSEDLKQSNFDAVVVGQDRNICKVANISADKKFSQGPKVDYTSGTNNEIFITPEHLSFKGALIGTPKCEKKFVDVFPKEPTSLYRTDLERKFEDNRCVRGNRSRAICRKARTTRRKVNDQKADCEPTPYTYKSRKTSDQALNQIVAESGKFIYFTRIRETGLRETASESVLQLVKKKPHVFLSPSMNNFCRVIKVPFKIEKYNMDKCKLEKYVGRNHKFQTSNSLEKVTINVDKPAPVALGCENDKAVQKSDKYSQLFLTLPENSSCSSMLSEMSGTSSCTSYSSASPPCESKKEISMNMYFLQNRHFPDDLSYKQSQNKNVFVQQISPTKPEKNSQNKNKFMSFCLPSQFLYTTVKASSLPTEDKSKDVASFPHKCIGCENLHKVVKRLKYANQSEKDKSSRILTENNKKASTTKVWCSGEQVATIKRKNSTKNIGELYKGNDSRMLVLGNRAERKISAGKRSPERRKEFLAARNNLVPVLNMPVQVPVLNISSLTYPMREREVSHKRPPLVSTHKRKKIKRSKKAIDRDKERFSLSTAFNKSVKDCKIASKVLHFNYKTKVPFFRKESGNSKYKQSLLESYKPQIYTTSSKNSSINTTPYSSTIKYVHCLPPNSGVKQSVKDCCLKVKISPSRTNCRTATDYSLQTMKDKKNSKTRKTKTAKKKFNKVCSPECCIKSFNKYTVIPFSHYKSKTDCDSQTEPNDSFTNHKTSHCEMNTTSDLSNTDDPNHSGACWSSYKNTRESISSFFTKFSAWSKNGKEKFPDLLDSQRGQIGFLQESIALPPGKTYGIKRKRKCFKKHPLRNRARQSIYVPSTAGSKHSQNKCCEVTIVPSFFRLLKCMNKTVSAPLSFNQGTVNASETSKKYPNDITVKVPIDLISNQEQFKCNYNSSVSDKSVTALDNNFTEAFSVLNMTESELNSNSEDHKLSKRSMRTEETKNSTEITSQFTTCNLDSENTPKQFTEKSSESFMIETKEQQQDADKLKVPRKNNPLYSYAPMSAAVQILRKGHISSPIINESQLGRYESFKCHPKIKSCPKQDMNCDYMWDQSSGSSFSSSASDFKKDHKVLTFGIIVATIIVQALLYFSVSLD